MQISRPRGSVSLFLIMIGAALGGRSAAGVKMAVIAPHNVAKTPASAWWSPSVSHALDRAGKNRSQLVAALRTTPAPRRVGLTFLIENMPVSDLQSLSSVFFEDVALAYAVFQRAPWKAPEIQWVNAVNVTNRYAAATAEAPADTTRLLIQVLDLQGKRTAARVLIQDVDTMKLVFQGVGKDESADRSDLLAFSAMHDHTYRIAVVTAGKAIGGQFKTGALEEQTMVIDLRRMTPAAARQPFYTPAPQPPLQPLAPAAKTQIQKPLADFFAASADVQSHWTFAAGLDRLLRENERAVRQLTWDAYKAAPIHKELKADFDAHQVQFEKYRSVYTLKTVGKRPSNGWPLVIALHGGGGAPKEVNDSQWQMMQIYYLDHPELGGYQYLALRAPNDTWNGFYDDYVYPLIGNLIRQQLLFNDVDPNKVFLIGYSHGGYGAFAIGPKMPDRFAAVHASASAPTDGETSAKTLRATPFSVMVGSNDTMYGRLERDRKFAALIATLRGSRTDIYPVTVDVKEGFGHGGLPDRDEIVEMYAETRNPTPRELTWELTDTVIKDFYWLHTKQPGKNREIDAVCRNNQVTVTTTPAITDASILLDSRLVDFEKPVILEVNGKKTERTLTPSLKTLCETLMQRGDPDLAFTAQVDLALGGTAAARH